MNEYNFNIEEIEGTEANMNMNNNIPTPEKLKKHRALKIAASLMAMTIVSASSIGIYHHITYPDTKNAAVQTADTSVSETIKAENVSTFKIDNNKNDILTTEEIVEKVMPAVVGIESTFTAPEQNDDYYGNDFGRFFGFDFGYGGGNQMPQQDPVGMGTGVVISEDGYIVTNAHVIYDSQNGYELASEISVLLGDDTYTAETVGYDVDCDLAVLKIDAEGLIAAEFGNSDDLKLGEDVTAIGNPLGFELRNTVTRGIVSGLNRNITINDKTMNLIQTDTAINSGNSGGPLINKYGQVIGINSSKMSNTYYGEASVEGICFAIPSNKAADVVEDFINYGYVKGKPQLGITCRDVTADISQMYGMPVGVYVIEVSEGSAAETAGLKKGDIITAVDDVEITTSVELTAQKNLHTAGDEIKLTFMRNGEEMTTTLTLDEQTENS